jgi:hypothetical protein
MSRLARLSSYKDGRAPSTTVKKLGFTAVRRLVRLKTVLYGYVRSLYGILPCLTAPSRRLLCSALTVLCEPPQDALVLQAKQVYARLPRA